MSDGHVMFSRRTLTATSFKSEISPTLAEQPSTCHRCGLVWPLPRPIRWPQEPTIPDVLRSLHAIPHRTTDTVIACQTYDFLGSGMPTIHEEVFKNFRFTRERPNRWAKSIDLVEHVRFNRSSGQFVNFKAEAGRSSQQKPEIRDTCYLRIITMNSWCWILLNALATTAYEMLDLQGNLMLIAALFSDRDLIDACNSASEIPLRWIFVFAWLLLLLFSLAFAYVEAGWEWDFLSSPAKGDLIGDCTSWSHWRTKLALTAFEFFRVEKEVRDIVTILHPWKNVMDFSAFKCEGHRAFFVGYLSKTTRQVENTRSIWRCLPQQLLTKGAVFGFKVYFMFILYKHQRKLSLTLMATSLSSFLSIAYGLWRVLTIWSLRKRAWRRLVARFEEWDDQKVRQHPDTEGFKKLQRQYEADQKLLVQNFHYKWEDEDGKYGKAIRVNKNEVKAYLLKAKSADSCQSCGRSKGQDRGAQCSVHRFDKVSSRCDSLNELFNQPLPDSIQLIRPPCPPERSSERRVTFCDGDTFIEDEMGTSSASVLRSVGTSSASVLRSVGTLDGLVGVDTSEMSEVVLGSFHREENEPDDYELLSNSALSSARSPRDTGILGSARSPRDIGILGSARSPRDIGVEKSKRGVSCDLSTLHNGPREAWSPKHGSNESTVVVAPSALSLQERRQRSRMCFEEDIQTPLPGSM